MTKDDRGEMYSELFKGVAADSVVVPLSKEVLDQARALAQENGWSEEEAFQIIFANGLFCLLGERRLNGLDGSETDLAAEVKRLTTELMEAQSKYAVMKFRAYTLEQDNQTLVFQNTGLRAENKMAMSRLDKFREDEEELRAKIRSLELENQRMRQQLLLLESPAQVRPVRRGYTRRMVQWLGRLVGRKTP